jgi:diguanylate cyclase (GGDEF)-like protein
VKTSAFDADDISFIEFVATQLSLTLKQSAQYFRDYSSYTNDALTGCLNRTKFDWDIRQEISQAELYRDKLSVLLINIDNYRGYQYNHGQKTCNQILKKVASILKSNIRAFQKIYRYEEDKFAIIITESDKKTALIVADRIQKAIESEKFEVLSEIEADNTILISIGMATFPLDGENAADLMEIAKLDLCLLYESNI